MSEVVIKVENLSKQYRLGQVGTGSLRDDFKRWRYQLIGKENPFLTIGDINDRTKKTNADYVWALKDINFEVKRGEVLGIIGKNGAGKSTLLKILSRTTGPSTGSIKMKGRVASLLEVGTGFHGELSGRENIFLNGAIMGMSKSEIKSKFDEIVDFAGVEKYIDTPVKRYSSGMYVRLAFGVAAHLEPDILIVDEVLAVGDAEFQKKAIGKMKDVSKGEGRTVLFVSHNMGSIKELCNRAVLLESGRVSSDGEISIVINKYLSGALNGKKNPVVFPHQKDKVFQLISANLQNEYGAFTQQFECENTITITLNCIVNQKIPGLYGYLSIIKSDGTLMIESDSFDVLPNSLDNLSIGDHSFRLTVPKRTLSVGDYIVYINFTSFYNVQGFNVDTPGEILMFSVDDTSTKRGNKRKSILSTVVSWDLSK